jgi:CheY-like chemotaxis protein
MLVDEDPVFRLGLRIWLEQTAGHRVVAEASQAEEALTSLGIGAGAGPAADLDLVILDLGLGAGQPQQLPGLQLCAEIKRRFPTLPVLVLSAQVEPVLQAAAAQMGADALGARGMAVAELDRLIRQLTQPPLVTANSSPTPPQPPGPWLALRRQLRISAIQQIDTVMTAIQVEQQRGRGNLWSEAVLAGRYRELRAARWLMGQLLATPAWPEGDRPSPGAPIMAPPSRSGDRATSSPTGLELRPQPGSLVPPREIPNLVLEGVFSKLQGNLDNTSDIPMESDILRTEKKRELLYLILRQWEDALEELRRSQVQPGELTERSPLVLQRVWSNSLTTFFGPYYTLPVDNLEQPVVDTLMAEAEEVGRSRLATIPLVPMLLGHLLFQEPMMVDGASFPAAAPKALHRSQLLLEHLLIQLANAVMQPLLNCFADVELIKKSLYHRRLISSRDIARFRNDLSWRYRWESLVHEPQAIFESRYRLFQFTERGIQPQPIYHPRQQELEQLSGLQWALTVAIETRDAVAPRFRQAISLVGSGIVYLLTEVLGRGIGLVGRGVLRGLGNRVYRD